MTVLVFLVRVSKVNWTGMLVEKLKVDVFLPFPLFFSLMYSQAMKCLRKISECYHE